MLTLIVLSTVLLQEPPAPPPPPHGGHTRMMVMGPEGPGGLDKDGDGQISREEFAAPMNEHFARMDTNGDGRLSTDEMGGGHGPGGEHDVMIMRRPGGPGEQRVEVRTFGDGATWTASGEVSRAVFIGGEPGPGGEREIIIHTPDGGPRVIHTPGGGEWSQGERRVEVREINGANDLDKDGDGRISEAEFTAPLREAFTNMDADRSGFIEEGERGSGRNVHVFTQRIETRGESDQ